MKKLLVIFTIVFCQNAVAEEVKWCLVNINSGHIYEGYCYSSLNGCNNSGNKTYVDSCVAVTKK